MQPDGSRQAVAARIGLSLMHAALRAEVAGIEAKCRGGCACVTCHVYVDPAWRAVVGEPSRMEESMLDFAEAADRRSRLSCQVRITDLCDGMVVETPPAQRVLGL